MNDLRMMTKVFIIESPSFMDIIENRKESDILGKTLDLAEIENETYSVSDLQTLKVAYSKIASDINKIKGNLGGVHIHFSMHGSKEGVGLSDKTFLEWENFYYAIKDFNDSIGYIYLPNGLQIAPTYLSFSVCDGFEARKIKDFGNESPYTGLIGPTKPVSWPDSLLAFSIFYQNTILRKTGINVALENMNKVIGIDNLFKIDYGKGLKSRQ